MKLLRYGPAGAERPGLLDGNGRIRSLEGVVDDWSGAALSRSQLARVAELDHASLPEVDDDVRIGPCVAGVGKFMCIGLNYADHAA